MEVVALAPGADHVCTRYRLAQFLPYFGAAGLDVRVEPLGRSAWERFRQFSQPRRGQLVLLVRKLLPRWQLALLRRNAGALVYDFDDAVFLHDSFHRRGSFSTTRRRRFGAMMRAVDLVLAGNKYLAAAARREGAKHKVHVAPTCIDAAAYSPAEHSDRTRRRLVWIGSRSTLGCLEAAGGLLEEIGREMPQTVLRVVCDRFPQFADLPIERVRWSPETEKAALATADIGFGWMPDDSWSRGKCGLKILQYMAAGLPVVANRIGVHAELVAEGTGFLNTGAPDVLRSVRTLSESRALRAEMGGRAREYVRRNFDVRAWAPVLAGLLRETPVRA
jgi:glycosyltransferase involved in cell wall biosynthesis